MELYVERVQLYTARRKAKQERNVKYAVTALSLQVIEAIVKMVRKVSYG